MPNFVFLGSLNLMLVVILGAFGAHALKARVTAEQLAWWHTGVQYHAWHALGLLAVGLLLQAQPALAQARTAGWLLQGGIVVFAGTLYAMALGGPRWLGAVTPVGGTLMIIGWAVLAWATRRMGQ